MRRTTSVLSSVLLVGGLALPGLAGPAPFPGVKIVDAWPGVEFKEPVFVTHAGDGTETLYVVEMTGSVQKIAKWRGTGDVPRPATFLDVSGKVAHKQQGGLLGLAFHPQYAANGRLYVSYLAPNQDASRPFRLRISEFTAAGGNVNPGSERVLLEVPKEMAIHQAGCIAFGPKDGNLYVGVGDGGKKNDGDGHAQNPNDLMGKILRIDVDAKTGSLPYGIPAKNPWANQANVRPEIWAYGFRNPWRFSFDAEGNLWFGEPGTTGAGSREWFGVVERGGNHGWPYREGRRATPGVTPPASGTPFVPRVFDYERESDDASTCGIGGYVYRGDRVKSLKGRYVFADFSMGEVYAIAIAKGAGGQWTASQWSKLGDCPECASLGEDAQGELYFCSMSAGVVMTLAPQ
jgi:glucose/arabinose dehydrogenase